MRRARQESQSAGGSASAKPLTETTGAPQSASTKKVSGTPRASQSAAAGGSANSEQIADTTETPTESSRTSQRPADYSSDADIRSRAHDWGWLGLLGLFGLLGLLRRRQNERHTNTAVSPRVHETARGVRIYETPDPLARP
ncbi:MAG: WGxxGxxG family protein [Burkholderiales bacterium]